MISGSTSEFIFIQIDAGLLTGVVAAYAKVFYRYRQRHWQSLTSVLAATAVSAE